MFTEALETRLTFKKKSRINQASAQLFSKVQICGGKQAKDSVRVLARSAKPSKPSPSTSGPAGPADRRGKFSAGLNTRLDQLSKDFTG
ncbi:hypothetical protein [Pseudomonas sp. S11A4]|uniref:hypothetical protein n=1 Tax=Pseudomonas sp. S11A4 TaxID=1476791 RepID=UPI00215BD032|nr:hypothetical protein [Pseudomonas sp. S11A4]MCR8935668.1 hypothetical protein [Pseudomonas sp. S11A4]